MDSLEQMSLFQFMCRVDRRGNSLSLRKKGNIVKEKPYLRLDVRRPEAGGMARMCLRLHRPFRTLASDPVHLDDAAAVLELHEFVHSATCPVWLKKRYEKHNRVKKIEKDSLVTAASRDIPVPAKTNSNTESGTHGAVLVPTLQSSESADVWSAVLRPAPDAQMSAHESGIALPADGQGAVFRPALDVDASTHASVALSGSNALLVPSVDENGSLLFVQPVGNVIKLSDSSPSTAVVDGAETFVTDTLGNRQNVAHQHGLLWKACAGDSRHSVLDALRCHKPLLKNVCVKAYIEALIGKRPEGRHKSLDYISYFVFLMLYIDLQPYERRGAGLCKLCLPKKKLVQLAEAFFQTQGKDATASRKKSVTTKPYGELWEFVKAETLKQCGLAVSSSPLHRVGFEGAAIDPQSPAKEGKWRQLVFCLNPHSLEYEEWEDAADREAKRQRYVQSAMHEQSMGRPGNRLHEVTLPVDTDALICRDPDTRCEWDALHPYKEKKSQHLSPEVGASILPETHNYVLKPSQGGMSHQEAQQKVRLPAGAAAPGATASLDPTQQSFVQHMCDWKRAYVFDRHVCDSNLPLQAAASSRVVTDREALSGPVLLLGTAGTGKTTTLQAANKLLEQEGFEGRIVRCAYTGVAASNLGAGGRTIVSLFRLTKNSFGGGLQQLSPEDVLAMDEDLRGMAVLEIDELSMIDKLVLAYIHKRLQQWRREVYHGHHCLGREHCVCGARLPFGGVKVILAGDFGQLPPVAVPPERTLLNQQTKTAGYDRHDVNLGLRLFKRIQLVFRLRRIHRQVGQSVYKESLLRLRDAAHTKEDVELWRTHDLTDLSACTFSVEERKKFEADAVNLFCENRRAAEFNGRRLGEMVTEADGKEILRLWSVESTPAVERQPCENYGGLRRVLHVAVGAKVMLTTNLRTVWNLVNGARGEIVAVLPEPVTGGVVTDSPDAKN